MLFFDPLLCRALPDESETHTNNCKTEVSAIDNTMEHEPEVVENVAYGTVSQQKVPLKERVVYDTPHNQVLMSGNAAYGIGKHQIPMNENRAYGIITDDGSMNDDADYWQ